MQGTTLDAEGYLDAFMNGFEFFLLAIRGRLAEENVPAGEYPIVAWLPTGDEVKGKVTVKAGASAEIKLDVTEVAKKDTHTRKDGTPYGRYK